MDAVSLARALLAEARTCNERRALVLAGDRDGCYETARAVLEGIDVPLTSTTVVSERPALGGDPIDPWASAELLGTTRSVIVLDAHDAAIPNTIGRVVGAVDGGGLFVLLAPPLDDWPARRDGFDEGMAVPPFSLTAVTGHFRRRLVDTLRAHAGIGIVDVDAGRVERRGLTDPEPRLPTPAVELPADRAFPRQTYEACLTDDQVTAVSAMEALRTGQQAVVVEADRGRGKSSAAGLAAGSLAVAGADVLVTAPAYASAREVFVRARALCASMGELAGSTDQADGSTDQVDGSTDQADGSTDRADGSTMDRPRALETRSGGRVRFLEPVETAETVSSAPPDVLFVDEAAALPVRLLERFLAVDRVAFTTTVHGYEGAGRGFSVRFRDRLVESHHAVTTLRMADPIRYAAGDPIEVWSFRALLLDARPPVDQVVRHVGTDDVTYHEFAPETLLADEPLLRAVFGLLVLAHYRTEPNDLARLLDGPNLSVRALCAGEHVVAVALLAREGGLSAADRRNAYDGGRLRGNMLPDVLTSQLRDIDAGSTVGVRIVRIAVHPAVRSRGLGSLLCEQIRAEFAGQVDWLGVGYGATPELLSFWTTNGYASVHLSTRRNDASGEHSAIMLSPTSDEGQQLHDRHASRFARRIRSTLLDVTHRDVDPDVVLATLRSVNASVDLALDDYEWRVVAGASYGPGTFDVYPGPFRRLAFKHLVDPVDPAVLTEREERLLVRRVLQARPWADVADFLGFVSVRQCRRALGGAFRPLVDIYGGEQARAERDRYVDDDRFDTGRGDRS